MSYKIIGYVFEDGKHLEIPSHNMFIVNGYDEARELIEDKGKGFNYYLFTLKEMKEVKE